MAGARELRSEADGLTYAETGNMMRGLADDYQRIADIAEAMAAIRRVLYYAALESDEKAPPERGGSPGWKQPDQKLPAG
jgi:hypothetical protein